MSYRRPHNPRQARNQGVNQQNLNTSEINFHRGEVLSKLSNTYRSLSHTLIEGAQNGIDAGADRIMLCIDLKRRTVIVVDNGEGTTRTKFEQALASVGHSVKSANKLGKFGLGLISPLNKCQRFYFISASPGRKKALKWEFVQGAIKAQKDSLEIPLTELDRVPQLPKRFLEYAIDEFDVEWRTRVEMHGVTTDKVISLIDIDELARETRTKLGRGMRTNKVAIRVVLIDVNDKVSTCDITPTSYSGEQLPVVTVDDYPETGRVEFELYRADKVGGKRSGEVSVMAAGTNYPITMREFAIQARRRQYADVISDSLSVLSSGYFEGVITCEKIELHPERSQFEFTDALQFLYFVIEEWYEQHGQAHYQVEQERSQDERYQETALKVADRLRQFLNPQDHDTLWSGLLSAVEFGRLGTGHLDPNGRHGKGPEDTPTIRSGQGGAGGTKTRGSGSGSGGGERKRDPKHRPGDVPVGAQGPGGTRRTVIKGDSKGLWFGFEQLPGNSKLWEFDRTMGILAINTRHPLWHRLDDTNGKHLKKNAKWIQQLLEWLAFEVLHLLVQFPDADEFELNRSIIDDKVKNYVEMFIVPTGSR